MELTQHPLAVELLQFVLVDVVLALVAAAKEQDSVSQFLSWCGEREGREGRKEERKDGCIGPFPLFQSVYYYICIYIDLCVSINTNSSSHY